MDHKVYHNKEEDLDRKIEGLAWLLNKIPLPKIKTNFRFE
jgi:hypothetical protein